MPNPSYLKQYTCHTLTHPSPTHTLALTLPACAAPSCLPHHYIDRTRQHQQLYLLNWSHPTDNLTVLQVRQFGSDRVWQLRVTGRVQRLAIVQDWLYVLGGGRLTVLHLGEWRQVAEYGLGGEAVQGMEPAFPQNQGGSYGVWLYTLHTKKGYRKRFYSPEEGASENWLVSLAANLLSKNVDQSIAQSTLRVLIPNVLGLVLLPNMEEFCLMNLNTMQIIPGLTAKLTGWKIQKPSRVLTKIHANRPKQSFDDCLLISIAQAETPCLEFFLLHLKYHPQLLEHYHSQYHNTSTPPITSFTSGDVIHPSSRLLNYMAYNCEGLLIDYILTEQGFMYVAQTVTKIPNCAYIRYGNVMGSNPVLCLEHGIVEGFLGDLALEAHIEQLSRFGIESEEEQSQLYVSSRLQLINSVLRPNRYSQQFLHSCLGAPISHSTDLKAVAPKKLFFSWLRSHKIHGFELLNEDILLLRNGCITTFLPIQAEQYQNEHQRPEPILEYLQSHRDTIEERISLDGGYRMSVSDLQGEPEGSGLWGRGGDRRLESGLGFGWEQPGWERVAASDSDIMEGVRGSEATAQSQDSKLLAQTYRKYYQNLLVTPQAQPHHPSNLITNKSLPFAKLLICNRVKDILTFHSRILLYLHTKITRNSHPNCFDNTQTEKLLLNYLLFLNKLILEPVEYITVHGVDLVTMFTKQEIMRMWQSISRQGDESANVFVDVEQQAWLAIRHIFAHVVEGDTQSPMNTFIKMIVSTIRSGFEHAQYALQLYFTPYSLPVSELYGLERRQPLSEYQSLHLTHNISHEQFHYPKTPALLTILCYLPLDHDLRHQMVSAFVLGLSQGQFVQVLREAEVSREFRRMVCGVWDRQEGTGEQRVLMEVEAAEVDRSRDIVYLSRVFEPEKLEAELVALADEDLEAIFRINTESSIMELFQTQSMPHQEDKNKLKNEDKLIGWVYRYRVYALKLKNTIKKINSEQSNADLQPRHELKQALRKYVTYCSHSLESARNLYKSIHQVSRVVSLPSQDYSHSELQQQSQQNFILRVCGHMLGHDSITDLQLFQSQTQPEQWMCLPTGRLLHLLQKMLDDPNTTQHSLRPSKLAYYYLELILDDPHSHAPYLQELSAYFSKSELARTIFENGSLREKYALLDDSEEGQVVRGFFGYSAITVFNRTSYGLRSSPLIRSEGRVPLSMAGRKSQSKRSIAGNAMQERESEYRFMDFRNAYLEVLTK